VGERRKVKVSHVSRGNGTCTIFACEESGRPSTYLRAKMRSIRVFLNNGHDYGWRDYPYSTSVAGQAVASPSIMSVWREAATAWTRVAAGKDDGETKSKDDDGDKTKEKKKKVDDDEPPYKRPRTKELMKGAEEEVEADTTDDDTTADKKKDGDNDVAAEAAAEEKDAADLLADVLDV
jgi:hypothetical protein